ncbi:MAG: peroxide stress protein YaaA [Bacteroidales bacterium]|nr:peroxide stress protein YaaA [Bacteroidales bacterium]
MIVLLSPAKSLDFESSAISDKISEPVFTKESSELLNVLAKLSANDLQELMRISAALAELNYNRFQEMQNFPSEVRAKQAVSVFVGEAYRGLSSDDFSDDDLQFAQKHLRILSGFYGVLRPLDLIQPYRLEMGTKLKVDEHENLYKFWGDKITHQINKDLKTPVIINLASDEYFKSVNKKILKAEIITPVFYDNHKGTYKMITVYAKNARGAMTRYIIKNRIENPEDLKSADVNEYKFSEEMSDKGKWVFIR